MDQLTYHCLMVIITLTPGMQLAMSLKMGQKLKRRDI